MSKLALQLKRLALWEGGLALVFVGLVAIVLFPLWSSRLLPMLEAPRYLAIARVWHDLRSSSSSLSEFFQFNFRPMPGVLVYWLIHMLLYVAPIEIANKIVLSAYLVLFPISLLMLARALGRSPWLAIPVFVLVLNRDWMFGYTGFLIGATVTLFGWTILIRLLDKGGSAWLALFAVVSVIDYFADPLTWILLTVGTFALCLSSWRSWGNGLRGILATGPSLSLALAAFGDEWGERLFIRSDEWKATYKDFPSLVLEFPKNVIDVLHSTIDTWCGAVVLATLVVLLFWGRHEQRPASGLQRRRLPILLLTLGGGYSLFPWQLSEPMTVLNCAPRVAPLLAAVLLLLPRTRIGGAARLVFIPVLVGAVILPVKLRKSYRDFNRRNLGFIRLTREIPRGSRALVQMRPMRFLRDSLDQVDDPASNGPVYWNWSSWPTALGDAYTPSLDLTASPISYKGPVAPSDRPPFEQLDLKTIHGYDYFLVRSMAFDTLQRHPALRTIDQVAEWTLLQKVFDVTEEP